jgi:glycosyltransferase involved in cell wall biosynthesis
MVDYLFFASNFNKWAGPNNPLLDLCNHLYIRKGLDIALVTHKTQLERNFFNAVKFPVFPVFEGGPSDAKSRLKSIYPNVKITARIIKSLNVPYNRIFVNSSVDTLYTVCLACKHRMATGYNALLNDPNKFPNSLLTQSADILAAKLLVGKILAHTNSHKGYLERAGVNKNRISVIPHCIDIERIQAMANTHVNYELPDRPIIFYAGRFSDEKGIVTLLESFPKVLDKIDATLVLAGDGPLKPWVLSNKKLIERKYGANCITYLGWQSAETVLSFMKRADVLVVPSYFEAFGMTILEGMCLKKPVVASAAVGGINEIITNYSDGLLVKPKDSDALANALVRLVEDRKMSLSLGNNGFKTLQSKYSTYTIAPRFLWFMS